MPGRIRATDEQMKETNGLRPVDVPVRVRYAETDAMGFVYHTNYLIWFEVGRAEYMRARGIPYSELEKIGVFLPLVECGCRFRRPGRYDDLLTVRTTVTHLNRVKLAFGYQILRAEDGQLLADGFTVHAFTDREGRPARLKASSEVWQRIAGGVELGIATG